MSKNTKLPCGHEPATDDQVELALSAFCHCAPQMALNSFASYLHQILLVGKKIDVETMIEALFNFTVPLFVAAGELTGEEYLDMSKFEHMISEMQDSRSGRFGGILSRLLAVIAEVRGHPGPSDEEFWTEEEEE